MLPNIFIREDVTDLTDGLTNAQTLSLGFSLLIPLTESTDSEDDETIEFQLELRSRLPIFPFGENIKDFGNDIVDKSNDERRQVIDEKNPKGNHIIRNYELALK